MYTRTPGSLLVVACAALVLVTACGDGATAPTTESVAGSYTATHISAAASGFTWDFLEMGASLDVVLNEDGTMSGQLFIPQSVTFPFEVDEDITGTWSLSGSTVTFSPESDVYLVDDVPFEVRGNTLVGDEVVSEPGAGQVRVRVTLARD